MVDWTCPDCGRSFGRRPGRHSCRRLSVEGFLAGEEPASAVYAALWRQVQEFGDVREDATKTQVAWVVPGVPGGRFAFFWLPHRALGRGPPDPAIGVDLPRRARSPRVREATQASPGHWIHHAMVPSVDAIDEPFLKLLRQAYDHACAAKEPAGSAEPPRAPRSSRSAARRP